MAIERALNRREGPLRAAGMATAVTTVGAAGLIPVLDGSVPADAPLFVPMVSAWLVMGAFLVWRRPTHPVPWILLVSMTLLVLSGLAWSYATRGIETRPGSLPLVRLAAFLNWGFFGFVAGVGVLLPLLFPTGQPPSPRWGLVGWAAVVAVALIALPLGIELLTFDGRLTMAALESNSVSGARWAKASIETGFILLLAMVVTAFGSLIARYRRASPVERLQLKWFLLAAALLAIGLQIEFVAQGVVSTVMVTVGAIAIPAAIGVAILRYRLYEIDRIISRTVSYALLVGLLGALFALGVIGLPSLFGLDGSPAAVAGSTLAVAGLFNPLRRRVQVMVDRRFNRSRYDAEAVVQRFATSSRAQVEPDRLADDVTDVVSTALQPSVVRVWVRPR